MLLSICLVSILEVQKLFLNIVELILSCLNDLKENDFACRID